MDKTRQYWEASHYDNDHDIAGPIQVAVTAPSSGSYELSCEVNAATAVVVAWAEDATISVAGTAMVWRSVERGDALEDATHSVSIEQGGTYTGGTTIRQRMNGYEAPGPFILKASTIYLITVTSLADNNDTTVTLRLSKHR